VTDILTNDEISLLRSLEKKSRTITGNFTHKRYDRLETKGYIKRDQATAETEQKSIAAIVNLRTEEAFRRRQAGEPPPNHGEIAVQAQTDYALSAVTHRRGKIVLGRLIALLQQEIGQNPRVYFPTAHLKSTEITAIARAIWPPIHEQQ
jgi:hypothetical protein